MPHPAVQFYHLRATPLERALPKLMEKALLSGVRAVIRGTPEQVASLDRALWTASGFLAHGTESDPRPERQPIYLATRETNPNGAALLVVTDGAFCETEGFERVFDLFDGTDEASLAAARARWAEYEKRGAALTYIRQKDDGGWEKSQERQA